MLVRNAINGAVSVCRQVKGGYKNAITSLFDRDGTAVMESFSGPEFGKTRLEALLMLLGRVELLVESIQEVIEARYRERERERKEEDEVKERDATARTGNVAEGRRAGCSASRSAKESLRSPVIKIEEDVDAEEKERMMDVDDDLSVTLSPESRPNVKDGRKNKKPVVKK